MTKVIKAGVTKRHTEQKPNAGDAASQVTKVAHDSDEPSKSTSMANTTSVSRPRNALVTIKKKRGVDHTLIETLAYYKAEKRHFAPGGEVQDWLEAEAEISTSYGATSWYRE